MGTSEVSTGEVKWSEGLNTGCLSLLEDIQGVPGGMDKTSGECSLC